MHDPHTVIKDFPIGKKHCITLWHKDPCADGTDDSCGRFIRPRHVNQDVLEKVKKEFAFNFKHNYWFHKNNAPVFTPQGVLLNMYKTALWVHYNGNRKKVNRFMRKYLHEILYFAENPIDCVGENINNKWNYEGDELIRERNSLAGIIYTDILRKTRPWWKHPNYHIKHWQITTTLFRRKPKGGLVPNASKA